MIDLHHEFGSDLMIGPTGDLGIVAGTSLGQQRVLRRLLTNAGDYIWQLSYGAGLAKFVGRPADVARVRGTIATQVLLEQAVARTPGPKIDVQASSETDVYVTVRYVDAESGDTQLLDFGIGSA